MNSKKNDHLNQLIYELTKNNDPPNLQRYVDLVKLENVKPSTLINGFTLIDRITYFCDHISEDNKKTILNLFKATKKKGLKI